MFKDFFCLTAIPQGLWRNRLLLWQWTKRLLKQRYAGSVLGPLWNVVTPLLMLTIYTFVFGIVFQARWNALDPNLQTTQSYAVILFCGLAMYQVFAETITGSLRCIIDNANLVKKVIFPLEILPAAQMLCSASIGFIWFALVCMAGKIAGIASSPYIILFPLAYIPLLALSLGIAWFVAATTVYLRDLPHLVAFLLQALFFMTPIFYPESLVPPSFLWVININPLTWLCRQCRDLLIFGNTPDIPEIMATWLVCGLICQAGFMWFKKTRKGFADVI